MVNPKKRKVHVADFGNKWEFLAGEFTGLLPLERRADFEGFSDSQDFAEFFATNPTTFCNYYGPRLNPSNEIPPALELAIALRYGFGPSAAFTKTHAGNEPLTIAKAWFSEHWQSWRKGTASQFAADVGGALDNGTLFPLERENVELDAAIRRIGTRKSNRKSKVDIPDGVQPPQPGINKQEGLVTMSALLLPLTGAPCSLFISLNPLEDRSETDRVIFYRLNAGFLRMNTGKAIHQPLGWSAEADAGETLPNIRIEYLGNSGPPVLWRLRGLDNSNSSFTYHRFGDFKERPALGDSVQLEIRLADISVRDENGPLKSPNAAKKRVWENLHQRAVAGTPVDGPIVICEHKLS